jgi:FkbM family methyltransferase
MFARLSNRIHRRLTHTIHLASEFRPFVLSNVSLFGSDIRLVTHEDDQVIGQWVRGTREWSAQDLAEYEILISYANSCRTIVDVGSNIGLVAILMSMAAPSAQIYAFEPDHMNFALSQINYGLNRCENIVGINAAIGSKTGIIKLRRAKANWGDHRTYAPAEAERFKFSSGRYDTIAVEPRDFFGASRNRESIDLLKIDTQGSDVNILLGFRHFLSPGAIVSIEFSPHHLLAAGTTEQQVIDAFTAARSIDMLMMETNHKWRIHPVTVRELVEFFHTGKAGYEFVGYRDLILKWA